MDKIAVFVNDVAAARHILQPMLANAGPTHWVLVACPPTLTRHIGRWVTHSARRQWRERWAAELLDALQPELKARRGDTVETLIANGPLVDASARLLARTPHLRLLDARQARVGREALGRARRGDSRPVVDADARRLTGRHGAGRVLTCLRT